MLCSPQQVGLTLHAATQKRNLNIGVGHSPDLCLLKKVLFLFVCSQKILLHCSKNTEHA